MAADVGEEELEAVSGSGRDSGDGGRLDLHLLLLLGLLRVLLLARARLSDLEAERLQLAGELLRFIVGQVVLEHERLELHGLDEPALLGPFHERLDLLRLNQFDQLVLRQRETSVLSGTASRASYKLTHHKRFFLLVPGGTAPVGVSQSPKTPGCFRVFRRGPGFGFSRQRRRRVRVRPRRERRRSSLKVCTLARMVARLRRGAPGAAPLPLRSGPFRAPLGEQLGGALDRDRLRIVAAT